jgi:SAM-dependent methyltransferase
VHRWYRTPRRESPPRLRVVDEITQRRAKVFGDVAAAYQRARPTYPMAAVEWMLGPAPGRQVLDLAAGTGKLTGVLLEAGAEVTAVEPLPGMRAELSAAHPGATVLEGSAEHIPLEDASRDAVLVAQAFHWFDPPRALDEMARVLRGGGVVGLCWNLRDDSVDWVAALTDVLGGAGDTVSALQEEFEEEEPLEQHALFRDVQRGAFPNPLPFSRERLRDWASSTSSVAILEPADRQKVFEAIDRLCDEHPALRGRETFDLPFVTGCVRAVRVGR